jgi:hypothetical protein
MIPFRSSRQFLLLGITMALFLCTASGFTSEKADDPFVLRELDFNVCDPVRFQAIIMQANRDKGTLTVAEKEIRLMDVSSSGNRRMTALLDYEGKADQIGDFKKGDLVLIEGFAHPEGFVAASKIQKIRAVTERQKTKQDPVRPAKKNNRQSNPRN